MHKEAIHMMGEKVGTVEEVDTNEDGECIKAFARVRISIDITTPLKKIIFLQPEGEMKIPIAVLYEKLPDFCFCCGMLGHQYRECLKYKGQSKEKLAFGR